MPKYDVERPSFYIFVGVYHQYGFGIGKKKPVTHGQPAHPELTGPPNPRTLRRKKK